MIYLLFWLQIFFQIKDEDAVKKYVYFGGIEHSIRKEVRLNTQETTNFFVKTSRLQKRRLNCRKSLSKNHAVLGGAVLFKKCSCWR